MTHFKLFLLTPQFRNNITIYMEDQIAEFYMQEDQDQSCAVKTIDSHHHTIEDEDFEYEDLDTQRRKLWNHNHNSFSYSYNEKITKEQNAQKTLTFEMNRYIVTTNEWRENPFARNLMIGSILLLKEYRFKEVSEDTFFTVTSIKYDFRQNNTIYDVTCQDSFTYQSARQNDGYEIINDPESSDFIGAKTIDWWIIKKIMPECHMNYRYLSMQTGLYLTKQGHYYIFNYNEKDNIQVPNNEEILKIVKEPYSPEEDADYFESFSFSCSNSNANAAIIELANLIDFQINTFEHGRKQDLININGILERNDDFHAYDQFFWVEPKQNDRRLGLEYTPSQSIKSFGLTHKGDSLTTILNVEGPTINDEVISLIPTVPSFFANLFLSGKAWDSSAFVTGFFSNICQGKLFMNYSDATADVNANIFSVSTHTTPYSLPGTLTPQQKTERIIKEGLFYDASVLTVGGWFDGEYRYFPIYTTGVQELSGVITSAGTLLKNYIFNVPTLYNIITFTHDGIYSHIIKERTISETQTSFNEWRNNGSHWELVLHDLDTNRIYYFAENNEFDLLENHTYRVFIRIRMEEDIGSNEKWGDPAIYINFYRNPTAEERSFAKIADNCPWLENKLIDFNYFYTNRIITESEYQELLHIINDELRIVNSKLIIYAQAYYNALHQETTILSNLQNKLDILGAECQASVINPCADSSAPKLDLSRFKQTYLDVITNNNVGYTPILNHATLLEEYFTKTFNTEQRFLKNIKSFRDYFNAPVNFAATGLYRYTLTLDLPDFETLLLSQPYESGEDGYYTTEVSFYSFANARFNEVTSNFSFYVGYTDNENHDAIENTSLRNYGDPQVPIYEYVSNNGYARLNVASQRNYQQLYLPELRKDTVLQLGADVLNDSQYNIKRTYYELIIKLPLVRESEQTDWYLKYDTNKRFKIGKTTSLTYNSTNPALLPWNGFYHLNVGATENIYLIAENIAVDKKDKKIGTLICRRLPIGNTIVDDVFLSSMAYNIHFYGCYLDNSITIRNVDSTAGHLSFVKVLEHTFRPITKTQIINDYLYRKVWNGYGSSYYKHNPETYYGTSNAAPSWFGNNASSLILGTVVKKDELNQLSSTRSWNDVGGNDYWIKYFPVNEVYYKGPKYKVTPGAIEDSYYFKRLNKKGQDQKDYYESLTSGHYVANPYNYVEYQAIPFINYENESEYFRRIHGNTAGKVWSYIGIGLGVTLGLACWPLAILSVGLGVTNYFLWRYGPTWFAKEGLCNYDFFDNSMGNTTHSGWYNWTSPTYALGEDSYNTYLALKNAAVAANGGQSTITISQWDDSYYAYVASSITSDTINLVTTEQLNSTSSSQNTLYYPLIGDKVGATLGSAWNSGLYYKTSMGKLLKLNDYIKKDGNYKIIWWSTIHDSDAESAILSNPWYSGSFYDAINGLAFPLTLYYPITNAMMNMDISPLDWSEKDTYTLSEILQTCGYHIREDNTNDGKAYYRVWVDDGNYEGIISFVEIRDYFTSGLNNYTYILKEYPYQFYNSSDLVYNSNDLPYDFNDIDDLTDGYFYIQDQDASFKKVSLMNPVPDFSPSETYYDQDYHRVYTIHQLKDEHPIRSFYLQCNQYSEELLTGDCTQFEPILIKNTALITFKKDTTVPTNPKITEYYINKFTTAEDNNVYQIDFGNNYTLNFPIGNIACNFSYMVNKVSNINGLTNGAFWYLYHTNLDHPLLLQQAAVIESQLNQYWQTAYVASKYCEFFLPEHWQPTYDTKNNSFASRIFKASYDSNNKLSLHIFNTLVPEVQTVIDEHGETALNIYYFKRANKNIEYDEPNIAGNYMDEITTYSAESVLQDNTAVLNIMNLLGEDLSSWYVEKSSTKMTYYYATPNTGMTWSQFIQEATKVSMSQYSGQYIMLYRILKDQYRELPMSEYYRYKKLHNHIWQVLYNKYNFMILQNTYKNEQATTSDELLQMAQYAFKNNSAPEAEYSISVLNTSELQGYYGQEIRIGDGIKIDAQAYYNEYDQIYNSLSQYLFISKISYALRNPVDVSLTVNDVQYEDKIVQRLVKLIK